MYLEDQQGRIAINLRYLLSYLQGKDGLVTMESSGGQSPVLFRYGGSPVVMIMPMLAKWESDAAPAEPEPDSGDVEKAEIDSETVEEE